MAEDDGISLSRIHFFPPSFALNLLFAYYLVIDYAEPVIVCIEPTKISLFSLYFLQYLLIAHKWISLHPPLFFISLKKISSHLFFFLPFFKWNSFFLLFIALIKQAGRMGFPRMLFFIKHKI